MRNYIYSVPADPVESFDAIQESFTNGGCPLNTFYLLVENKMIMVLTSTRRLCEWYLEFSSKGRYHLAVWP